MTVSYYAEIPDHTVPWHSYRKSLELETKRQEQENVACNSAYLTMREIEVHISEEDVIR